MTDTPEVNDIPAILARASARNDSSMLFTGRNTKDDQTEKDVQGMAAEILSLRAQLAERIEMGRSDEQRAWYRRHIKSLRADQTRLRVLEEMRESGVPSLEKQQGSRAVEVRSLELGYRCYRTFTEAADAEIARRVEAV